MKITKRWSRMSELYKRFASDYPLLDYSDLSKLDAFELESYGKCPNPINRNGFVIGKKLMDVTVAMWKEDLLKGNLTIRELLDDLYPEWFLIRVKII